MTTLGSLKIMFLDDPLASGSFFFFFSRRDDTQPYPPWEWLGVLFAIAARVTTFECVPICRGH